MIDELMAPKDTIISIPQTMNCLEAVQILEDNSLRSAPVLDASKTIYRGNIYRYHIYQYHFHHPEEDLKQILVTRFLKNTTKVVRITDTILDLFFAVKDLPYVAVLNADNAFMGIIRHQTLLSFFNQSWAMNEAGYLIMVESLGKKGDLMQLCRLINRYTDIVSCMTLDRNVYHNRSTVVYQLPKDLNILTFQTLIKYLEKRHYNVQYWQF
ncbi:CBS domain-containing protein [Facklamia sp. DSM 111018]|uniref:CBS domain-containing protein n=1 Tax=Facklamia lactis TaxID=2749967 RepID=A0ABS0LQZ3_9LACT|nr:cyclic di-AMP binding protein CbpA [Facklamia lactis]MBG9980771.1 CBS domain-containing protein [Facklamia lactis]MBG9986585.1 CBS domain-containing protein [Facklamia lactis]